MTALRTYTHSDGAGLEYHGTVEVRQEDGWWSVYVNSRKLVDRESFVMAERIADGIVTPGIHWPSEADEVSTRILAWLEERASHD